MSAAIIASDKNTLHITDIIDIDELRELFDAYSTITGMVTALLDLEGRVLIATNWQDSCTKFHRMGETTSKRCLESDTALAGSIGQGQHYTDYRCRNGLVDVATPVIIEGMHLANFFTGQFFYQTPDLEYFERQAQEAGFDKDAYLDAIKRVPVYDWDTIRQHMAFLVRLAELVGKMGAANLKTQRANRELEQHKNNLEALVDERTAQLSASLLEAKAANMAKTKFLTNMSHELRTPLHAILGFSEVLSAKERNPQKSQHLDAINVAGTGLLSLINSILDVSRIESGKMPVQQLPMSIKALVSEIHIIFQQQATEKGLSLNVVLSEPLPDVILFDEAKLRQILINLVSNAIKFTCSGQITLRASMDSMSGGVLHVCVQDTGKGISPQDKDRIFEAFAQAEGQSISEFGGSGIGLAVVKQLVSLLNGNVVLESEVGQGSAFHCYFPDVVVLTRELLSSESAGKEAFADIRFAPAKILFADDNTLNRNLMRLFLGELNFTLLEAVNGQQAVEMIRQHMPDLVIMDMKMPVLSGYEATEIVKQDERTRNIPVIAATASALEEDEIRIRQHADDYLRKPIRKRDLIEAIKRYIPRINADQPSSQHRKILVVDDNETNCVLLSCMLEGYGNLEVQVVKSGQDAVAIACSVERPDVIFMDYQMPGMDGLEATQRIRKWEQQHQVRAASIYVITAMSDEEVRNADSENLFDGFLGKPFEKNQLDKLLQP